MWLVAGTGLRTCDYDLHPLVTTEGPILWPRTQTFAGRAVVGHSAWRGLGGPNRVSLWSCLGRSCRAGLGGHVPSPGSRVGPNRPSLSDLSKVGDRDQCSERAGVWDLQTLCPSMPSPEGRVTLQH